MQDNIKIPAVSDTNAIDEQSELAEIRKETKRVLSRFNRKRENLVTVLQQIQERLGYLPREALLEVAQFLKMPPVDVYGVVTFYNQFRLNPPGKHSVRVCLGTACHMKGGYIILDAWKRRLNIGPGNTTLDREFDLDTVACVGCCAMAPVNVIDSKVEGKMSPTRVDGILLAHKLEKEKKAEGNQ
jgi:NADH-quinone oxidoreductase subunit E